MVFLYSENAKLENITVQMLGKAKRVTVTKDNTTIVVGDENKAKVEERVKLIKRQIEASDSEYDKEKLQERLAKLSGGVAVIEVGAWIHFITGIPITTMVGILSGAVTNTPGLGDAGAEGRPGENFPANRPPGQCHGGLCPSGRRRPCCCCRCH